MIKRDAEESLKRFAEGFPAVSVIGPRQSGKTTLVRSVFPGSVPEDVIAFFQARVRNNTLLAYGGTGPAHYVRKWKILDNVGEENILSWWSHG